MKPVKKSWTLKKNIEPDRNNPRGGRINYQKRMETTRRRKLGNIERN